MSVPAGGAAAALPAPPPASSRRRRLLKVAAWLVGIVVLVLILQLLGVDVTGWLHDLWTQIKAVPPGYIVAALVFQTGQTVFAGYSYYGILSAAYPGEVTIAPIVTAYAVGRRDEQLPAGEHRHVRDAADVRGASSRAARCGGSIAAYLVQKIFFTIAGTLVYLYLFLSVPGSFDPEPRQRERPTPG